jgi:hypothetical protein
MTVGAVRPRFRSTIIWLRFPPPIAAERAFNSRGYHVVTRPAIVLEDPVSLSTAAAVVIVQMEDKPRFVARDLMQVRLAMNLNCRVIVVAASDTPKVLPAIVYEALDRHALPSAWVPRSERDSKERNDLLPHIRVFNHTEPWDRIANYVVENEPGEAPNLALVIDDSALQERLPDESRVLIQRAFSTSKSITLMELTHGRSGALAFQVFSTALHPVVGHTQLPHFLKIGPRDKIIREQGNYQTLVDPGIPFHLAPQLDLNKSCLGSTKGIIVGDYVGQSESLVDVAKAGRAGPAVQCLFDQTLHTWHRNSEWQSRSLAAILGSRFPRAISAKRESIARLSGATKTLAELRALFDRCDDVPTLVGLAHGDLHAENVRVRGADGILIDFYSAGRHPLLFDAASLESSFVVEALDRGVLSDQEHIKCLKPLYDAIPCATPPLYLPMEHKSSWIYACIQQVRRYARTWQLVPTQYSAALALALLIKASKPGSDDAGEIFRRSAAYLFAELLLLRAFEVSSVQAETGVEERVDLSGRR